VLFVDENETIHHLFFSCPMARLLWFAISITFGVSKPTSTAHLFGPWLRSFPPKQRNKVLVGVAACCWAIWLSRNEIVFQKSMSKSILQVIFRGTFWIRGWSILSKEEDVKMLKEGCRWLETVAVELFNKSVWNVFKRIKN
jgi:hypothetical protein